MKVHGKVLYVRKYKKRKIRINSLTFNNSLYDFSCWLITSSSSFGRLSATSVKAFINSSSTFYLSSLTDNS
ncbi:hypothetical protein [Acidianus ambivalens]|uniref:hypothetical protein n=1 Tax=Acidianus ambivalens TaxID=2283 RepID=UPI001E349F96|nr:hypothetical protein [Acidianus ambivalens]